MGLRKEDDMVCCGNALLGAAILNRLQKPARYTGGEYNSVKKNWDKIEASIVLAMPDVYEVGLSNLGLKILYEILNNQENIAAERLYAPWTDLEQELRENKLPLTTLETDRQVKDFDLVGFSLQYELSYTNVLNMLDLSGITLWAKERSDTEPLIAAGGPCAFNAEPLADFIDFFILGEGEEVVTEAAQAVAKWKKSGKQGGRADILKILAGIEGIYVPSLYQISYNENGQVSQIAPLSAAAKSTVNKRIIADLDKAPFVQKPIVPYLEIVHDRIMLELFRGCTRGCRFCQAGILYRPVREKRVETLLKQARQLVSNTGYDEISLVSLSSADYSGLPELIASLTKMFQKERVSVSLPSLRIDSFSIELAQKVGQVRKSSLTFAPEAGTQRLRDVINKGVSEENLLEAAGAAFKAGWSALKLYFMIGLPTETDADVAGIAELARKVSRLYREITGRRGVKITVSVSSFVPKAHTPFQRAAQNTKEELERKQKLLRSLITEKNISLNWHDAAASSLEAVLARGDRKLGQAIFKAWQKGAKFDGWSEHFKYNVWLDALRESGIEPQFYANRERDKEEILPWAHLSSRVDEAFLAQESEKAAAAQLTPDCRNGSCGACGACFKKEVKN
ncbi:MAG: TIGR03960 family B12-binding radical SAM protein [Sporomusaceae bacterium]|jgi:radical SAM family uncharacterized protein|nr:TIGR03960 family B12-binding radical SAM protein [Sporomusaceae bacterium]